MEEDWIQKSDRQQLALQQWRYGMANDVSINAHSRSTCGANP